MTIREPVLDLDGSDVTHLKRVDIEHCVLPLETFGLETGLDASALSIVWRNYAERLVNLLEYPREMDHRLSFLQVL
jgi:hypothetical protein